MEMEDFLKKVLCVINIIFVVFGLAISATGIWFLVQITAVVQYLNLFLFPQDRETIWQPWMFIIVGILMTLAACIGWSGTSKESCRILRVYGGVMTFIIVFKILSSLIVFVYFNSKEAAYYIAPVDAEYYKFHFFLVRKQGKKYELIERKLKCCGFNDATDYHYRNYLPLSCCTDYPYRATCEYEEAIKRLGCSEAAVVYINTISVSMAAALLLPIALEISGIIVARRLSHLFKEVEHYSKPIYINKG